MPHIAFPMAGAQRSSCWCLRSLGVFLHYANVFLHLSVFFLFLFFFGKMKQKFFLFFFFFPLPRCFSWLPFYLTGFSALKTQQG